MSKQNTAPKIERRFFSSAVEERAAGNADGFDFGGLASRTGTEYVLYENSTDVYVEEIAPTAFDNVLGDDVRVLFNHKDSHILGRTKSGTAKIMVEGDGLRYAWKNDPAISYANDLAISIRRGDIDQSSFGFSSAEENSTYTVSTRADGKRMHKRMVNLMDALWDVSPVTYPASASTEVSERDAISAFEDGEKRSKTQCPPVEEADVLDIYFKRLALNEKLATT